jgi:hypothetical protein
MFIICQMKVAKNIFSLAKIAQIISHYLSLTLASSETKTIYNLYTYFEQFLCQALERNLFLQLVSYNQDMEKLDLHDHTVTNKKKKNTINQSVNRN